MSANRLVSIVVTNFNYADYLAQAVSSAARQTYPHVQVIVVDDASTDSSVEILERLSQDLSIEVIKFPENRGQAAAMNEGFRVSQGVYVMFLDSDDLLEPTAVERLLEELDSDSGSAQFFLQTIDSQGDPLDLHPFCNSLEQGDVFRQICASGHFRFMPTSGNLFVRSVISRIMPIPETEWRICADTYLVFAAAAVARVQTVRRVLGSYRVHTRNAWYRPTETPEQMRQIKRNHLAVWLQLLDLVPTMRDRGYDDYTSLSLIRRIAVSLFRFDGNVLPERDILRIRMSLIRRVLSLEVSRRERMLHVCMLLTCRRRGRLLDPLFRGLMVPALRSGLLHRLPGLESPHRHDWLLAAPPARRVAELPVGKRLSFGHAGPAQQFHWYGFGEAQSWRSWASAERAGLLFRLPAGTHELTLALEIQPYTHGKAVASQRVRISTGKTQLYSGTLAKQTVVRFPLCRSPEMEDGVVPLEFELPDAVVPELVDRSSTATRITSIALVSIAAELPKVAPLVRSPVVDTGDVIACGHPALPHFFSDAWDVSGPIRLTRKTGSIHFTLPEPTMRRIAVVAEFAAVPPAAPAEWRARIDWPGVGFEEVDLRSTTTVVVVAPLGKVPSNGAVKLDFTSPSIQFHPATGLPGLHLQRLYVRDFERAGDTLEVFRPMEMLFFGAAGRGGRLLLEGWREPGEAGTWMNDTVAALGGHFFNITNEIFLTARITSSTRSESNPGQRIRLSANGLEIASYHVAGTVDLIAVCPASVFEDSQYLRIELRCECAGRATTESGEPHDLGVCLHHLQLETLASRPAINVSRIRPALEALGVTA